MKVVFLSIDGLTDPLGQSQILPYLVGLSRKGVRIVIISLDKSKLVNDEQVNEIVRENKIEWYPIKYLNFPPVISTLWNLYQMYLRVKKIARGKDVDIIHCRGYMPGVLGMIIKKRLNIKYLFDIRGFWADERIEGGIWNLKIPVYRFIYGWFKRKEPQLYQNADHVISLTHRGKEIIESGEIFQHNHLSKQVLQVKIPADKITVIPCCVDLEHFDPEKIDKSLAEQARQTLAIKSDSKVVVYSGSLGTWYMVKEMLDFVKNWVLEEEAIVFVIYTKDDPTFIYEYCDSIGLDRSHIRTKSLQREEMPVFLSLADYALFFINPFFSKNASSPTKQGEFMAMNIPLLCNKGVGDTDEIVEKYNSGWVIDLDSNHHFDFTQPKGPTIRKGAEEYFSLDHGIEKYFYIYRNLCKS